jgi:hypothetical protein
VGFGQVEEPLVHGVLAADMMTLEFDVNVGFPKGAEELLQDGLAVAIDMAAAQPK